VEIGDTFGRHLGSPFLQLTDSQTPSLCAMPPTLRARSNFGYNSICTQDSLAALSEPSSFDTRTSRSKKGWNDL